MVLVRKKKRRGAFRAAPSSLSVKQRPRFLRQGAPCDAACPCGSLPRDAFQLIAQRAQLGLNDEQALRRAFDLLAASNPFLATLGRVCPHPCENACYRAAKDGAVSIQLCERFIGDVALAKGWPLPLLTEKKTDVSVGIVGAGPAGLSFAYQLARLGAQVTVYEKTDRCGGMLQWGIPRYRLPEEVLQAEIQRIVDVGVRIHQNCEVGRDVGMDAIRAAHQALFIGIGASQGRALGIKGEIGVGLYFGTDFLRTVIAGELPALGHRTVVVGGGNTAVDAARVARRNGLEVVLLYRRSLQEMPADGAEIEDAQTEGVDIWEFTIPVEILRKKNGRITGVRVSHTDSKENDGQPEAAIHELQADSVIVAVSREPVFIDLGVDIGHAERLNLGKGVWFGGDMREVGDAAAAVGDGRLAALEVSSALGVTEESAILHLEIPQQDRVHLDNETVYPTKKRIVAERRPQQEWLDDPYTEIRHGLAESAFFESVSRCLSCGRCFGCDLCWQVCTPGCIKATEPGEDGYFHFALEWCDGCGKCVETCPSGCLVLDRMNPDDNEK